MKYLNYAESCLEIEQVSIEHITVDHLTPFYCYSKKLLIENISDFFEGVKILNPKVCYSLKANSNISLLKLLSSYGAGADVVSEGEFRKAIESGIKPSDIVFSGVGKTDEELAFAIENNCFQINIESGSEILRIDSIANQMSKTQNIAIRLNPDVDSNTHEKITTGTKENKFGIPLQEALEIFKNKSKFENVDLNGIAVHIGSDIKTLKPFLETLKILKNFCEKVRSLGIELNTIDLGGGLSPVEREFDIKEFAHAAKKELGEFNAQFIFEPGRIISADAGILVTKIVSIKGSGAKKFIIVDAGMNDLIRPALYGASHKILPIRENIEISKIPTEIVGPICESSDSFLKIEEFPDVKEGDFLVIMNAGAYGSSMSSNYNIRPLAAELLIDKDRVEIIRNKQSFAELFHNEIEISN